MPGERTPDSSPANVHGSSDDAISLREHMQRQLDTQHRYFTTLMDEHRRQLDERYQTQTKALDAAFAAAEKAVQAALLAAERAVAKAETSTEKRFESQNEFRGQLNDQAQTFISRAESLSRHDRTAEQVADMAKRHETDLRVMRERFESDVQALRDRHDSDVKQINSRLDLGQGRSTGLDKAWASLVAAVVVVGGVIAAVVAITN